MIFVYLDFVKQLSECTCMRLILDQLFQRSHKILWLYGKILIRHVLLNQM